MEGNDALKDYVNKKLNKMVNKYFGEPVEAHVVLSIEKFRHIAEVTILINGIVINVEEETNDMQFSIDNVIEKIEHRLRKYKDKIRNKKFINRGESIGLRMKVISQESIEKEEKPAIVKSKSFYAKPMSVEEAVMQMDLLNNNFLVFKNSTTNRINVVYRRKDGDYGLIEPKE
jgi:putative sigma-54 modulation protein